MNRSTTYLADGQEISLSLRELHTPNWVSLDIDIKQDGWNLVNSLTLVSHTVEQEQALRMLAQAWHEYKATLEHLASL